MTPRREARSRHRRHAVRGPLGVVLATVLLAAGTALTGCAAVDDTVPSCTSPLRLAIIAQSVPSAAYVPCIQGLAPGWRSSGFDPSQDGTGFLLDSDRSPGRPVTVRLTAACLTGGASPSPSRGPGVLTYMRLSSVSPRFAGTLYDVFPGGCVSYGFDFVADGSQIALMDQFEQAIGLYPRQQLRLALKRQLGVELNP